MKTLLLIVLCSAVAYCQNFPPSVITNKIGCVLQPYNLADSRFDIQTAYRNRIYNTVFTYQLNEGDPGYAICYVNAYRSVLKNYDCSIIGRYNCHSSASDTFASYASTRSNSGGTICYAISTYQNIATALLLIGHNNCTSTFIVNIGDDPCAALSNTYEFKNYAC